MFKKPWFWVVVGILAVLLFGGFTVGKFIAMFFVGAWQTVKGIKSGIESGSGGTLQAIYIGVRIFLRM